MSDNKHSYRIHPAIGFARVGNSPDAWYLEPTEVGGLPTERDDQGHEQPVTQFKHGGQIKRQAARFRIYRHEAGQEPVEVSVGKGIRSIKWSVHVANKKAAWYQFQELQGDVMIGENNSYMNQGVPLRNPKAADRQKLIIDPGPRALTQPGDWVQLDAVSAGDDYPHVSFPSADLSPYPITTLGAVRMTERGELLVLGGYGNAGGPPGSNITTFAGADGWFDDVSDGPVYAEVETDDGQTLRLNAWVVSGAPKLAPELVNIASLADTFIDVGVRLMGLCPALFTQGAYQPDYSACLERDILPIFSAMKEYRWVANVDAMVSIATPPFDLSDLSEENRCNREAVFAMFRNPGNGHYAPELAEQHQQLFAANGFPLMPLNSGDNSISNIWIEKFMALTPTQYYLLHQWAAGKCVSRRQVPPAGQDWPWASPLDIATAGNAVGEPMAPGIEVTWTMRNPIILTPGDPFRVQPQDENYHTSGLCPSRDETLTGGGCQPGDLTKRMAIPWQADFFDCSVQAVNFTTPRTNKIISNANRIPLAPTFFAYWWPAQSPYNVYDGASTAADQALDGGQILGQNVLYHRGLNSFLDAVVGWKYLGFVLNRATGAHRDMFRFFIEQERSYAAFQAGYYGLTSDGQLYTTQPSTTTTNANVNNQSQNVLPLQWLVGN
ncbi:MAG TPA: CTQ-dependent lysine 6-oxidase LodA [Candidatus Tectomicrobia bacterium]